MNPRHPLITDHWFREGPVQPDGSDGYWICDYRGCGQHRGDHLQAEGDWRKPLHAVVPMRIRPSHCKACGRHHRHTTHTPWTWEQLEEAPTRQESEQRRCGDAKPHPAHTFMRLEVLFQCPGEHETEGQR